MLYRALQPLRCRHVPRRKENITGKVLLKMTFEELKSMGLTFGNAKLLKDEIDALNAPASAFPSAQSSSSAAAASGGAASSSHPHASAGPALYSPALDPSALAPFISRVMSADDEDLELRNPIQVRAWEPWPRILDLTCVRRRASRSSRWFRSLKRSPCLPSSQPSQTCPSARARVLLLLCRSVTLCRACSPSSRQRPASKSLRNWGRHWG